LDKPVILPKGDSKCEGDSYLAPFKKLGGFKLASELRLESAETYAESCVLILALSTSILSGAASLDLGTSAARLLERVSTGVAAISLPWVCHLVARGLAIAAPDPSEKGVVVFAK
jgi:putative Mn2+ efflux pump MntP